MKKNSTYIVLCIVIFFAFLFSYAALSKAMGFTDFQIQLAQSPLLSAYAGFISYGVIILELAVVGLLCFKQTRLAGLYASFGLMTAFTVYIWLMLNYSDFVPCSCGGILEKMTWDQHLVFNTVSVLVALASIIFIEKERAHGWSRTAVFLAGTAVLSAGSIVALFLSSEHIMKRENSFIRRFAPHPVDIKQRMNLKFNSYYFAGQKGDTVFLGNRTAPLVLTSVLPSFREVATDTLKLDNMQLPFKNVTLQVQYPAFSVIDGQVPVIFEGRFPNKLASTVMSGTTWFSQIQMLGPHRFIFRGQSTRTGESIMGLLVTDLRPRLEFNTGFLEKQIDGVFDTDGHLIKDAATQELIYTYHYRNEYRRLDSLLRFRGNGRTIDTISTAQIKLTTTPGGKIKMATPPLKVNKMQAAYGGLLFNLSALRGKYESAKMWRTARVADVYQYGTAEYLYSFYLYPEKNEDVREILVTRKYLYMLSGNYLIRYQRMHASSAGGRRQGKPKT